MFVFRLFVGLLILLLMAGVSAEATGLKGTYKCSGYNISGAGYNVTGIGGSCHFFAPLVLKSNGTYHMLPERGKYTVSSDLIYLSESKYRGPGKLHSDGNMITFNYEYAGKRYFVTYSCQDCSRTEVPLPVSNVTSAKKVKVDLLLHFAKDDGLFSWVNKAYLVPLEHGEEYARTKANKDYIVIGESRQLTRKVVSVGFQNVKVGQKYIVFLNGYGAQYPVAFLDLTQIHKPVDLDLNAALYPDLRSLKSNAATVAIRQEVVEPKFAANQERAGAKTLEVEQVDPLK